MDKESNKIGQKLLDCFLSNLVKLFKLSLTQDVIYIVI